MRSEIKLKVALTGDLTDASVTGLSIDADRLADSILDVCPHAVISYQDAPESSEVLFDIEADVANAATLELRLEEMKQLMFTFFKKHAIANLSNPGSIDISFKSRVNRLFNESEKIETEWNELNFAITLKRTKKLLHERISDSVSKTARSIVSSLS